MSWLCKSALLHVTSIYLPLVLRKHQVKVAALESENTRWDVAMGPPCRDLLMAITSL